MSLQGKVVVITGATRGIGRAAAEECAQQGARVAICGRDAATAEAVAGELSSFSASTVMGVQADVSNYEDVSRLRDQVLDQAGKIDVWFNNAGISLGYCPLDEIDAEKLGRLVAINLTGHIYGCRAILPYFRQHGGYLMNMVGRGYRGEATPHTSAYAATKAAIASLTLSLAKENRDVPRLSVNALVPGMVQTDFYRDIYISPRLEHAKDNWRYALDAFGVPMETVARKAARLLGDEPGRESGRVYSLLTRGRVARGVAKMAWYGMTGKMARE